MSNTTNPDLIKIESPTALAKALADLIASKLTAEIEARGQASLVLSGGSTPKPLFEALRTIDLDWGKVSVTLADERWVPESDSDSNAAFVKNTLLQEKAAAAKFVSLYKDGVGPHEGVSSIHQQLQSVPQPFTVVVLGMGGDGHTASLFPGAPGTMEAMNETQSLVSIVEPETVPQARITLTLAALMNTDCQLLHITGAEKRTLVDEVLADPTASNYPIAKFLNSNNPRITVYTTH